MNHKKYIYLHINPEGAIKMMESYNENLLHLVFERHSDFNVMMLLATACPQA
jgi:hypothetical protein